MVKEVTMYTVVCDGCGKDANEGTEFAGWNNKSYTEDVAIDADWIKQDEKHYCPDCYTYDDEDNLVVKSES